jgi:hypothetical protein
MWLDDCRIPFVDDTEMKQACKSDKSSITKYDDWNRNLYKRLGSDTKGRFTPNLLVCDDMLNDGSVNGSGSYSGVKKRKRKGYKLNPNSDNMFSESPDNYGDKGSNSRYYDLDKWFDKMIDEI